jgi:hypothetical protein
MLMAPSATVHGEGDVGERLLEIENDPPIADEPFSLFKIARIRNVTPGRVRIIRDRVSTAGHAKRRHEVPEFYRCQVCGKDRKERRWTKVSSHMRGKGSIAAKPLHIVRAADLGNLHADA